MDCVDRSKVVVLRMTNVAAVIGAYRNTSSFVKTAQMEDSVGRLAIIISQRSTRVEYSTRFQRYRTNTSAVQPVDSVEQGAPNKPPATPRTLHLNHSTPTTCQRCPANTTWILYYYAAVIRPWHPLVDRLQLQPSQTSHQHT